MPFTARRDPELSPEAIRAAHARIHPAFRDSPQYVHEGLSAATGAEVELKVETVNPIRAFKGRHYRIHEAYNVPKPVQPGGPPILIGGGGEQRTLRIAAKHADMTHWFPLGFDMLRHKNEVLEGYCAGIGRDPAPIERTMAAPAIVARDEAAKAAILESKPPERRPHIQGGTPAQTADAIKRYIDAAFTGFTFDNTFYKTPEQIALVGEVLQLIDR